MRSAISDLALAAAVVSLGVFWWLVWPPAVLLIVFVVMVIVAVAMGGDRK